MQLSLFLILVVVIVATTVVISSLITIIGFKQAAAFKRSKSNFWLWYHSIEPLLDSTIIQDININYSKPSLEKCYLITNNVLVLSSLLSASFEVKTPIEPQPDPVLYLADRYLSIFHKLRLNGAVQNQLYITNYRLVLINPAGSLIINYNDIKWMRASIFNTKIGYRFGLVVKDNKYLMKLITYDYNAFLVLKKTLYDFQLMNKE